MGQAGRINTTTASRVRLRAKLEQAVERALAALDLLDGDADLEDGGDNEPSRGSMDGARYMTVTRRGADGRALRTKLTDPADQTRWADYQLRDLEEQCEDEGGQCDDEGGQCDDEGAIEYETCHRRDYQEAADAEFYRLTGRKVRTLLDAADQVVGALS